MTGFGAEPQKLLTKKQKKEKESSRNLQRYRSQAHVGLAPWRSFIMRMVLFASWVKLADDYIRGVIKGKGKNLVPAHPLILLLALESPPQMPFFKEIGFLAP